MHIDFEEKSGMFVIDCAFHENKTVMAMPDRRFRKTSKKWVASSLRRNISYMSKNMADKSHYTPAAWAVFQSKLSLLKGPAAPVGMPSWYKFKNPPRDYQKHTMDKAFGCDYYGLFFEQGLGKTFTSINLACAWRMENQINAVVVVCPSSIKLVWEEELEKHCVLPYEFHALEAGKYKKATDFIDDENQFPWFVVGIEALSQGAAKEYLHDFLVKHRCLFLIDESSSIKNEGKTRTDVCIDYSKLAKKRIVMSGTSITQGIEDLYAQLKFLDADITGFDSFYSFRSEYCVTMPIEVQRNKWVQKIIGYKNENELLDNIAPYVSRVEKKDALDLPDKVFQNRYVTMTPAQSKMYLDMKHELFVEYGDGEEYVVDTVLEKILRLQQITSGFHPYDDGENVVPVAIPGKNPKIEELINVLNETNGKVIVWCLFRAEVEAICERLKSEGIGFVQFHGGIDSDGKKKSVTSFRNDKDTKVFVATKAAAYGITLTEASTAIYYGVWYSSDIYLQSQDRMHRIGQTNKCNYVHLVCPNTIDVEVMKALGGKISVAEMFYGSLKQRG